jgi:hypothetical protein
MTTTNTTVSTTNTNTKQQQNQRKKSKISTTNNNKKFHLNISPYLLFTLTWTPVWTIGLLLFMLFIMIGLFALSQIMSIISFGLIVILASCLPFIIIGLGMISFSAMFYDFIYNISQPDDDTIIP